MGEPVELVVDKREPETCTGPLLPFVLVGERPDGSGGVVCVNLSSGPMPLNFSTLGRAVDKMESVRGEVDGLGVYQRGVGVL